MDTNLKIALRRNFNLQSYLSGYSKAKGSIPEFFEVITRDMGDADKIDLVYPVGDPIFIHVHGTRKDGFRYTVIEPTIDEEEKTLYDLILERLFILSGFEIRKKDIQEFNEHMEELLNEVISIDPKAGSLRRRSRVFSPKKVYLTPEENDNIRYHLRRNILNSGILEPLIRDPYIEDISCVGLDNIHIVHKVFNTLETNLTFLNIGESENYLRNLSERIGRPLSETRPITDSALPDGSRLNLIFSKDVSVKGPSFTIRKFSAEPLSITQLIGWETMNSEVAAYIWLCVENGINIFICGETASGKTTTLNAILSFIKKDSKIISVEDTAEVLPPHDIWQQYLTRETGAEESRIDMFTLLSTALRSRPDYILIGEIRGSEGAVAFQAMQAGRPVISTFHAASISAMIRRFTGHPINVPIRFMDNLNVAIFQNAVYRGSKIVRKISSLSEIISYSDEQGGILTRDAFVWNPSDDTHRFRGRNNSYILENKIAEQMGYEDRRRIYHDMNLRKKILEGMVKHNIFSYKEVVDIINNYQDYGLDSLPFKLDETVDQ